MNHTAEEVRAQFETWAKSTQLDLALGADSWGSTIYKHPFIEAMWDAWKAAYAGMIERREAGVTDEVVERACKAASEHEDELMQGIPWPDGWPEDEQKGVRSSMRAALTAVWPVAAEPAQPADSGRVMDAREYLDNCVNALDHIARTARRCRVTSRRLTWIASRAESAINGDDAWRDVPVPKNGASALLRAQARVKELEAALAAQGQSETRHPDDDAVDAFAAAMKEKLAFARAKGRGGWQDKNDCPQQRLSDMLRAHVAKGDPCDVANFAMFLHQRGEAILPAPPASGDWGKVREVVIDLRRDSALLARDLTSENDLLDMTDKLTAALPENAK